MSGKILVVGANGTVGTSLVPALLRKGEKVVAGSREGRAAQGAEPVRLDLRNPSTLPAALKGVDRIYALSPAGDVDQPGLLLPLIEAAAKQGAKMVLQTAIGVDADDNIPFRQVELALERSGTPFVILRPNWFADNFATYWGKQVRHGEIRVPAGDGKSSFIDSRDIAAAAAAALTSNAHDGKAFNLTGPAAYSYAEAAAMLSKALGRTIGYRSVDDATFKREMISGGLSPEYAEVLAMIFYPVAQGWTAGVTDAVEALSGKAPRSLQASIDDLAGTLKAAA
jgi:uncharacterized protein YbjT (DUF2867 family)